MVFHMDVVLFELYAHLIEGKIIEYAAYKSAESSFLLQ
jgi:hypothetical protein